MSLGPEPVQRHKSASSKAGEYADLPKFVLGIPCAQHHPIKIIEVLNHYDMPCTVTAEKYGLLQAMVPLQPTLTDV